MNRKDWWERRAELSKEREIMKQSDDDKKKIREI